MEKVRKSLLIAQLFVLSLGVLRVTAENRVNNVNVNWSSEALGVPGEHHWIGAHRQLSELSEVASSAFREQQKLLNQLSSLGHNESSTKISIELFKHQKEVETLTAGLKQGLELVEAFFNWPGNCYALTTTEHSELGSINVVVELLQKEIRSNLDLQQRTICNLLSLKGIIFRVPNLAERLQSSSIPTGLSSMIEDVIKMEDRLKLLQQRLFDGYQQLAGATSILQKILSKHAFKQPIVVHLKQALSAKPAPALAPLPGESPALPARQVPELLAPPVSGKAPALAPSPELPAPPVLGRAPVPAEAPELPAPPVSGKAPALAPSPELPAYAPAVPLQPAPALAEAPVLPAPPVPSRPASTFFPAPEVPAYVPVVPLQPAPALAEAPTLPADIAPMVPTSPAPALAEAPAIPQRVEVPSAVPVKPAVVLQEERPMSLLEQIRAGIQLKSASERVLAEPRDDLGALREVLGGRRQAIEDEDSDEDEEDLFFESDEEQLAEERAAARRAPRSGESVDLFERLKQQRQFAPSGQVDTDNDDEDWS